MYSNSAGEYAGFWRRFVATLIDGLVSGVITWALLVFSGVFDVFTSMVAASSAGAIPADGMADPISMEALSRAGWVMMLSYPIYYLYMIACTASPMRGTLGKFFLDVAIVDKNGKRIGLLRSMVREIGKILSAIILMIGYIMAAFGRKRGLHDFIAGTLAVRAEDWENEKVKKPGVIRLVGNAFVCLLFVGWLGYPIYGLVTKQPFSGGLGEYEETIASLNKEIQEQQASKTSGGEFGSKTVTSTAPRKRSIDYSGIDILQQHVEDHAVSKQVFPSNMQELGVASGDLFDRGIQKVDVLNNGVLKIQFKAETAVGGALLVMAPYIDAEGYIGWNCRSVQIREADFPELCD